MKQHLYGFILMGMSVIACDQQDTREPSSTLPKSLTTVVYNPALSDLPLPNDILFSGSQDLTINVPGLDETDFTNPRLHLSSIDGWGTIAPFTVQFETQLSGTRLDESTIVVGQTVRLFETVTDTQLARASTVPQVQALGYELVRVDEDGNPTGIAAESGESVVSSFYNEGANPAYFKWPVERPIGNPAQVVRELTADDYEVRLDTADPSGLTIEIVPKTPLKERTTYLLALTSGILDTSGSAVGKSAQYGFLSSDTLPSFFKDNASFQSLQRSVLNLENVVATSALLNKSDIILTSQFTTQSIGRVFEGYADQYFLPSSATVDPVKQAVTPAVGSFTPLGAICTTFSLLCSDGDPSITEVYQGKLLLPYLLDSSAPLTGFWQAPERRDVYIRDSGTNAITAVEQDLFNFLGSNLSHSNNVPDIKSYETVPVLLVLPAAAVSAKPANGYPVVIFQHGITGDRSNALSIARSLASQGIATIAIDLPLHGITSASPFAALAEPAVAFNAGDGGSAGTLGTARERTFNLDLANNETGAAGSDGVTDASGTYYLALSSPLTLRDNNRQGALDLMQLYRTLPIVNARADMTPDLDINNVSFVGHSLGGIVGSVFVSHVARVEDIGPAQKLKSVVLANAGGHISRLLERSPALGGTIQSRLAASESRLTVDTADYNDFFELTQAVVDAADPLNAAEMNIVDNLPTLLFQSNNDPVVVNEVSNYPTVGSEFLAQRFTFDVFNTDQMGLNLRGLLRFQSIAGLEAGGHASLLVPAVTDPANANFTQARKLTVEMQTVMVTFIASGGAFVDITDATLLESAQAK